MPEVRAEMVANVWKVVTAEGEEVSDGSTLVILESMKMEMPIEAPDAGTVKEVRCQPAQAVNEGDVLVVLDP